MDTRDEASGGGRNRTPPLPDWTDPIASVLGRLVGSSDDAGGRSGDAGRDPMQYGAGASAVSAVSRGGDRVADTGQARKLRLWFGEKNRGRL